MKKRKELSWSERKRILHQAEAIRLLELAQGHPLHDEQHLKIDGRSDLSIRLRRFDDNRNWIDHEWLLPLWNMIFWPALDEAYQRYLAELQHVAETGDISRIRWEIPEEPKENEHA